MIKDAVIDCVHRTIYGFIDVVADDSEEPMNEKDKLLLEVNKAICNALKEMPDGKCKADWIPATERLPEETGFYLCTLPMYHEEPMVDVCLFDKATGGFLSSGIEYYVVAWMPLPMPYKESDKSENENDSERSD